jgi:hypothetical protein
MFHAIKRPISSSSSGGYIIIADNSTVCAGQKKPE